jgi:hypothetical protein
MGQNSHSRKICKPIFVTYDEILNEIELQYGKWILPNTLAHLISRASWCNHVQGIPMDEGSVCCSEDATDKYFNTLERLLSDVP